MKQEERLAMNQEEGLIMNQEVGSTMNQEEGLTMNKEQGSTINQVEGLTLLIEQETNMMLNELKDDQLEKALLHLTSEERRCTAAVLEHLREVEERKLFARRGYSSLFSYCTDYLGYSEGAASRRIGSMRLLKECPEMKKEVTEGALSLSNVAKAASFFRQEKKQNKIYSKVEKTEILNSLSGKSQKEAETTLIKLSPQSAQIQERQRVINDELTELRMTIDMKTSKRLDRLRQLKPEMSLAELLNWMVSRCLKQIDPLNKPKSLPQRSSEKVQTFSTKKVEPLRKVLTRKQKYEVWKKAEGKCQFTDHRSKRKCQSHAGLEIDHVQPLILGGSDQFSNLRLLCRAHHKLVTTDSFGSS